MINGGLGLLISGNSTRKDQIAYGVVAGLMWLLMIIIGVVFGFRRPAADRTRRTGAVADGEKSG
jgi:hypothetical protein